MNKRLFIIDGHAYAYRAFYAIRQLNSPAGQPTNAIYGFIRMLGKMVAFLKPSHGLVVWDGGLAAERVELHPAYKTQRPPMPDLLEPQLDEIVAFLRASHIPSFLQEGVEADDWIATLAKTATEQGFDVVIASSDKDFMQLVSPAIGLLNPNDKEPKIWKAEDVRAKTGVEPHQIVDWLSLIGDSVDNIPGVPGIGSVTAAKLLQQFGSLEAIYARLADVTPPRIQVNLRTAEELVKKNRRLIQLHTNVPGVACCEEWEIKSPNFEELRCCYARWGFKGLLQELDSKQTAQGTLL
jgi:DNA polymerase I